MKKDKFKVNLVGDYHWDVLRDFLVTRLISCNTKKELEIFLEGLIRSMFKSVKELDKARKELGIKPLS